MKAIRFLFGSLSLVLAGCGIPANQVANVEPSMLTWAQEQHQDPQALTRGRTLYLTACTRCHSPVGITRFSSEAWATILPRMSARAGLGATEFADLASYVRAVLQYQALTTVDSATQEDHNPQDIHPGAESRPRAPSQPGVDGADLDIRK